MDAKPARPIDLLISSVIIGPFISLVTVDIHIDPHQQLQEWALAMKTDLLATDDLNQLLLTVDGAADGVHTGVVPIGTCGQQVSDHQQVVESRIRIILTKSTT